MVCWSVLVVQQPGVLREAISWPPQPPLPPPPKKKPPLKNSRQDAPFPFRSSSRHKPINTRFPITYILPTSRLTRASSFPPAHHPPPRADNGPPTPTLTGPQAPAAFLGSLTPRQARSSQVAHIHLFTPLHWLEDGHHLRRLLAHPALDNRGLRTLTLTIRHTDWWWWEAGAAPSMSDAWLRAFVAPPGLRELRVEYETLACGRRRPHLDAIVARNKRWRLRVRGGSRGADNDDDEDPSGASGGSGGGSSRTGGHLSAEHTQLEEWTWRGTSRLGGRTWEHLGEGPTVDYVVVRDTWRYVEGPIPDDALRRQHAQGWVVPSTEGGISPYKNSGGQEVVPYDEKYDDDGRL